MNLHYQTTSTLSSEDSGAVLHLPDALHLEPGQSAHCGVASSFLPPPMGHVLHPIVRWHPAMSSRFLPNHSPNRRSQMLVAPLAFGRRLVSKGRQRIQQLLLRAVPISMRAVA
ncbi:UNVERIFIED_CONTAM: hypothetical protein Slati_1487300 [Sesamum latifolium]|uniref:Uncharacterized protein n=1 Tax=Sesamum latifolium TaxID=2727402 RepID=A0AAW2X7Y8_9LAMI